MNRAMILLKTLYEKIRFLGGDGPSKIRLLQSYEVFWIHVIDAICSTWLLKGSHFVNWD